MGAADSFLGGRAAAPDAGPAKEPTFMEIQPASLAQVTTSQKGRMVLIDPEVAEIAADIQRVHEDFRLRVSERTGIFIVYQVLRDATGQVERDPVTGEESQHLVTTWDPERNGTLDQRIVHRCEQAVFNANNHKDFLAEVRKVEAEAQREDDRRLEERLAPVAEKFAHAIRSEDSSPVFIPGRD